MLKRIAFFFFLATAVWGQGFQPQDADESEAWNLYNEYLRCKASQARVEATVKQKFADALMGVYGNYGVLGVDREANAEAKAGRLELDRLRQHEQELLDAWDAKFYWRYGDLRWATETIQDPKTGQTMDRIQFALIYFRFHRQAAATTPPATTSGFVAQKGGPDTWSHLQVGLGNVSDFSTEDQTGWRNNGTGFKAVAGSGTVPVQLAVSAKGDVTYEDYQLRASVRASNGRELLTEASTISRAGGSKSLSVQWQPAQDPGPLEVRLSLSGGNPESFTYFVSGRIDGPSGTQSPSGSPSHTSLAPPTSGPPVVLYSNGNDMGVGNGGKTPLVEISAPVTLTEMTHYHWNDGQGAPAGTIALRRDDGTVYGPWQANLINGVYWVVQGQFTLPPGRYSVLDSDPATWSQNSGSGGCGIVIWKGRP